MIGSEWEDNHKDQTSWIDPISMDYHLKQWHEPKQSTKAFCNYFSQELETSRKIIDLGAGAGAATFFLASKFLKTQFLGVDLSIELIDKACEMSKNFNLKNLSFETGDWFNLGSTYRGGLMEL